MSTHVNPPWKSALGFAVVAALAWASYEYLWVRRIFASSEQQEGALSGDQRDAIRAALEQQYSADPCFEGLRGHLNWRPRDDTYRVELIVSSGCEERARTLCHEISASLEREWRVRASVWAFDATGRQLASFVP